MNTFWSFVKKEFKHIFRDRWTMVILLVMPIIQILIFGFALSSEVRNTPTVVYLQESSPVTERIIHEFEASPYFTVVERVSSLDEAERLFREGRARLVLGFSNQFQEDLYQTGGAKVQLIADGSDPNQARTVVAYAQGILQTAQQELLAEHQLSALLQPNVRMLYNPQTKSSYNFVPGVMGMILLLICAMMTSIAIVREKETGTMEILLASPLKPFYIILAKAVPYFTLSLVNLSMILLLSVFVLGVPIAGSLPLLLGISMIYIFLSLALGLLISTLAESQLAAMLTSGMALMSPTMIFSGMMFPIESMPSILQWISTIVPARWYIAAMRKVMIQGVGLTDVALEVTILSVMAVALIIISLRNFKTRLG